MYPVYGLAEASLAVTFPEHGGIAAGIHAQSPPLSVGQAIQVKPRPTAREVVELICDGQAIPYCNCVSPTMRREPLAEGAVGHVHIRGDERHARLFRGSGGQRRGLQRGRLARPGDLGLFHEGELYIAGRAKEIIFVNGQNYYPHDLEAIAQRAPGLELGKVVAAGVRRARRPERAAGGVRSAPRGAGGVPAPSPPRSPG